MPILGLTVLVDVQRAVVPVVIGQRRGSQLRHPRLRDATIQVGVHWFHNVLYSVLASVSFRRR